VLAAVLIVSVSLVGWAQCGCNTGEAPDCYLAFRTTQTIQFALQAPVDYFIMHGTSVSPSIFGWRVEAWDGSLVRTVIYPGDPKGRWLTMEWDLYDDQGYLVSPGFYSIIVMTTDGDVAYPVKIVNPCVSFCDCFCGCYAPMMCDVPCCIPFGELYLTLDVGEERPCSGLNVSLTITIECEEEEP
jgi:hypothetical protein